MTGAVGAGDMKIESLREFLAFAKHLNYTAVAKTLNTSQASLSRHVAELEAEVGVQLVGHQGRTLFLTPAGKHLLQSAEEIVFLHDRTLTTCRELGSECAGHLCALMPAVSDRASQLLLSAYRLLAARHPDCDVTLRNAAGNPLFRGLERGTIDVGMFRSFAHGLTEIVLPNACRYPARQVAQLDAFVWMERTNPLAQLDGVRVDDLAGVPVALPTKDEFETERMMVYSLFLNSGVAPRYSYKVADTMEEFGLAELSGGVFVLTRHLDPLHISQGRDGMVARPLVGSEGPLRVAAYAVWQPDGTNPLVMEMIDLMRDGA